MRVMEILLQLVRRMDDAADLARKLDTGSFAKSKPPDVFVKALVAKFHRQLCRTDVAGFHQDFVNGEIAVGVMVVKRAVAIVVNAVFAEDDAVGPDKFLVQRGGGGDDFER